MEKAISYRSTRGGPPVSCLQAILQGIAPDGGLYVPESFPWFADRFNYLAGLDYRQLAAEVMENYLPDFSAAEMKRVVEAAYDEKFDHPDIAPLVKKGDYYFLELFHGPTLAFKDMALSVLPHLVTIARDRQKKQEELVILTATSGDTGKAALEGFANVAGTRIIVFYPLNGVSRIQQMQMVTQVGDNTHVAAIEGNFDDAQRGVKEAFADNGFRKLAAEKGFTFSSANSINIGRLVPQVVYYLHSYLELLKAGQIDEGQQFDVCVPTGNFGNILAAYYARKSGVPIGRLICASNINNVLYDFIKTGTYNSNRKLMMTSSPSMDILVSSNLERLLYHISGNNSTLVAEFMESLKTRGSYTISESMKAGLSDFYPGFATEEEAWEAIATAYNNLGYLIDTHTAVGFNVAQEYRQQSSTGKEMVVVSTASPFKFPAAVLEAIGASSKTEDELDLIGRLSQATEVAVPEKLGDLEHMPVRHKAVCPKDQVKQQILKFLGIEGG